MAQAPRQGIPPAPPTDPNAGRNIHGQPNQPPDPNRPENPNPNREGSLPGQGPRPNMAPPQGPQSGLADNTKAEMEAGKKNLEQYVKRDDAEHEAGRKILQQHADRN
jgi:hypothetical protein